MAKVVIYTTRYCPYCRVAKRLLAGKNIAFEEIDVENDPEKRQWLEAASGQKTVPQIFINEQSIGGYEEIVALDQAGKLDSL